MNRDEITSYVTLFREEPIGNSGNSKKHTAVKEAADLQKSQPWSPVFGKPNKRLASKKYIRFTKRVNC